MKCFIIFVPLLVSLSSIAQDLSVGFRTGIARNFFGRDKDSWYEVNNVWNKQAFFRHEMRKKFALEFGFEHFSTVDVGSIPKFFGDPGYHIDRSHDNNHYFVHNFSFQYEITPASLLKNIIVSPDLRALLEYPSIPLLSFAETYMM